MLVRCLGRAVKPNRLLLPALVPAVRAVVRLPPAVRVSDRESFRGAAFRENVPVRPDEPDLAEPEAPLLLRLAQFPTADFPFRFALAAWPLPLAERPAAERGSGLRRGGREFPAGCAGLRFRAWAAERLKWLRGAAGLGAEE